jgi:CBS domain-containing protein
MSVNTLCSQNVAMVAPGDGVIDAARLMREKHVGDLIVVEHRAGQRVPVGILTDRDIVVGIVARGASADDLTVADVMSSELLKIRVEESIEYALREMRRAGVRRVPVVDGSDDLIGVLSIDDVIDHLAVQLGHVADIVRMGRQAEFDKRP